MLPLKKNTFFYTRNGLSGTHKLTISPFSFVCEDFLLISDCVYTPEVNQRTFHGLFSFHFWIKCGTKVAIETMLFLWIIQVTNGEKRSVLRSQRIFLIQSNTSIGMECHRNECVRAGLAFVAFRRERNSGFFEPQLLCKASHSKYEWDRISSATFVGRECVCQKKASFRMHSWRWTFHNKIHDNPTKEFKFFFRYFLFATTKGL